MSVQPVETTKVKLPDLRHERQVEDRRTERRADERRQAEKAQNEPERAPSLRGGKFDELA